MQELEKFDCGILVPGDLDFLCVAYLLDICSWSAAGEWQSTDGWFQEESKTAGEITEPGKQKGRREEAPCKA